MILQNASKITASGETRTKNAKPVVCLDTGEVYTSATDAAKANGVSVYSISMNCLGKTATSNGKRFCYIKNIMENFDVLMNSMRDMIDKANAYDEIIYKQQAVQRAEEKLAKCKANCELLKRKLEAELLNMEQAETELNALRLQEAV